MARQTKSDVAAFQQIVQDFYREHGRHDLPWRQLDANAAFNPYHIVVSELMLQQTQVARVIAKFDAFLKQFPTIQDLAAASLADVLRAWSGLGYNRRAKFLHSIAQQVVRDHAGNIPQKIEVLTQLPGIGPNTAGAILVYAYNQPQAFIETNVRVVFIHHFFSKARNVGDKSLLPIVQQAMQNQEPRKWYWALMDYGTHIKKRYGNVGRASKHFVKQSRFEGSNRQIRGQVLQELGDNQLSVAKLSAKITDPRLSKVLEDLQKEGLITQKNDQLSLYV